jgi:hypothetical protein
LEYGDLGPLRFCRMTASAHRYSRHPSKALDALDTPLSSGIWPTAT